MSLRRFPTLTALIPVAILFLGSPRASVEAGETRSTHSRKVEKVGETRRSHGDKKGDYSYQNDYAWNISVQESVTTEETRQTVASHECNQACLKCAKCNPRHQCGTKNCKCCPKCTVDSSETITCENRCKINAPFHTRRKTLPHPRPPQIRWQTHGPERQILRRGEDDGLTLRRMDARTKNSTELSRQVRP